MGWDGMGWDGIGWDGMGWDGVWDGMGWCSYQQNHVLLSFLSHSLACLFCELSSIYQKLAWELF